MTAPSLFAAPEPLAARMRPRTLDECLGQEELLGPGRALGDAIRRGDVGSAIFWGPPGTGKTTIARLIAQHTDREFVELSAVLDGVPRVREIIREAEQRQVMGRGTVLFCDEIHRFNRAQQDAFLPFVEAGDIVLVGATTENPSFELNGALLSRLRVIILPALGESDLIRLMKRALADQERGLAAKATVEEDAFEWLGRFSDGDARRALTALEAAISHLPFKENSLSSSASTPHLTVAVLEDLFKRKVLLYDKSGDEHFNLISALHKSLRDSDVDASLYWLARMLEAGEDPLYVARRLVRFASEDIGLADPSSLTLAVAAKEAVHFIGMPEGALALAEIAVHMALAPKSNALYTAYAEAAADVHERPNEPPPLAIRNAPTKLMKQAGYGAGYRYAHDTAEKTAGLSCLPDSLADRNYYRPSGEGREKDLKARAEAIRALRSRLRKTKEKDS